MCDECEYAEDCFREEDCVYDDDCNLKEEEECTDSIEEALRDILNKESERMKNK